MSAAYKHRNRRTISVLTRARGVTPRKRQSSASVQNSSTAQPDLMQQWIAEGMPKFLASVNLRPAAERSISKKTEVLAKPEVKTSIKPAGYIVFHRKDKYMVFGCGTKLELKRHFLYGFRAHNRWEFSYMLATAELVELSKKRWWPVWHGQTVEMMWRGQMEKVAVAIKKEEGEAA
jgi:hypothetical protein